MVAVLPMMENERLIPQRMLSVIFFKGHIMQNQVFNHLIMCIWDTGGPISRQSAKKDDSVMFLWAASVKAQEINHAM